MESSVSFIVNVNVHIDFSVSPPTPTVASVISLAGCHQVKRSFPLAMRSTYAFLDGSSCLSISTSTNVMSLG